MSDPYREAGKQGPTPNLPPVAELKFNELYQVLRARGGYEVVSRTEGPTQLRLLGRVPSELMDSWKVVMHHLLNLSERSSWSIDISKQYFLRHGKLVYGWRTIIQGPDVSSRLSEISDAIRNAPRAKVIIEEQRLVGVSANRNSPKGGKGAQGVLTAVVGPMAIAAQRAGGG